jgi:ribosomal protein S27E
MVSRTCQKCKTVWYSADAEQPWKCSVCGETIPANLNNGSEVLKDILPKRITRNMVKCLKCGDTIESKYRHDFQTCSCDNVSVDGGTDYLRRCFVDYDKIQELSTYEGDQS